MRADPSIAVVGAGAVGSYYGGRLAEAGWDVHFLLRSDYEHVRRQGMKVKSVDGDFVLPAERIRVYDEPSKMPKADLVLVTLKSTENHQFERLITPLLHEGTAILTLQNGLGNEADLARLFGESRVLGGIAFVCINRVAPGEIHHLDRGYIRVGEYAGPGRSERAERIAAMFNDAKVDARVLDDVRRGRWEKLVWNIPFNGLGALLDATTEDLLRDEAGRSLVRDVMKEVLVAAAADGVKISADLPEKLITATLSMGAYKTSTQLDRQAGRKMEIASIFGRPVEAAKAANVPVPLMQLLHFALRRLDAQARQ